jgi:CHAD domain-containing protein
MATSTVGGALRPGARGLVLSPDDGAGEAARAVLRFQLRAFARTEAAARAGDVEGVHQMRVATRRLRAALRFFAPVLPARFVATTRREFAWLADVIGGVRDADVLSQAVSAHATRLAPELRGMLGPVGLALHERRTVAHAELTAVLESNRCQRLFDRVSAFSEPGTRARREQRLGQVAGQLVRPLVRAVRRAGRGLDESASPQALHRLRVRVKRLRYALDTLRGLGDRGLAKLLRRLERMQSLLGEHQDAVTAVAWLERYAETPGISAPTLLATGALIHRLSRRARRFRARFPARWQQLDRRRLRERVVAELVPARQVRTKGHAASRLRAAS